MLVINIIVIIYHGGLPREKSPREIYACGGGLPVASINESYLLSTKEMESG